ncbi:hypothetical protein EDD18DRAFT_1140481 [Armillaria luteobubalina]|uniref:Uncharacterized protein n=1 Tax=Armillaria luteobubalina TaxID=153913 RepID=A0AA39UXU8_9AGAR|nr:hypothetical protein EDD18DRAFT_1140481 [Armillaria luteobubalina]
MPAPLLICALCVTSHSSCPDVTDYFQKSAVYRRTLMRNAIRVNNFIVHQAKRYRRKGRSASVGSIQPGGNQNQLQDRFLLLKF